MDLNNHTCVEQVEFVAKSFPTKKTPGPESFQPNEKGRNNTPTQTLPENWRKTLPNLLLEAETKDALGKPQADVSQECRCDYF